MPKTSYAIQKGSVDNSFVNPNFSHRPALVLKDGTLFVVVDKWLYRSDDSGYTWDRKQKNVMGVGDTQYMGDIYFRSGQTAENDGDPITCVELSYVRDYAGGGAIKIEFGGGEEGSNYPGISNSTHGRWHFLVEDDVYYDYGALVAAAPTSVPSILNADDGGSNWFDSITDGNFSGIFTRAYATEGDWDVSDILLRDGDGDHTDRGVDQFDYHNKFCAVGSQCMATSDEANDQIIFIDVISYAAGTVTETAIYQFPNAAHSVTCIAMAKDEWGTLVSIFLYGTGATWFFASTFSYDSGANWSGPHDMTPILGGTTSIANVPIDIMGCADGFIYMYVQEDSAGVQRLYVNTFNTTDGATYTNGTAVEATSVASDKDISGGYFFRPEEDVYYGLDKAGGIRIAYLSDDAVEQELLEDTAFPASGSVNDVGFNQDFITIPAASGNRTDVYLEAFNKIGVTCSFHSYEPNVDSKMNDRSSYDDVVNSTAKILIDPQTYDFPIPDLNTDDTLNYIEQDARKVFLPPNKHLDRAYLVNEGNFLKRTVWTMDYDGNAYELSQVVPRFIDEQICYYHCNAYVIGQSRDPWSRTVLLSET